MDNICPLTGKPCTNPKTVNATLNADGKKTKLNLCSECSLGATGWTNYIKNIFASLKLDKLIPHKDIESVKNSKDLNELIDSFFGKPQNPFTNIEPCPGCGITINVIIQNGKLGCWKCYDHFKVHLQPVIERVQEGNSKHLGKCPRNRNDIDVLKKEMDKAIREEKYEQAAVLRDRIKEIEKIESIQPSEKGQ